MAYCPPQLIKPICDPGGGQNPGGGECIGGGPSWKFPMYCDIWAATYEQDDYGMEVHDWNYDRMSVCYFNNMGAVQENSIKEGQLWEYEDHLIGRTPNDIRYNTLGLLQPITSLLITNIRNGLTGEPYFTESAGEREGYPTLFDILATEPYINPWNEVEYWKIYLGRSDKQAYADDFAYV